jgi:hypothetical protein
LVLLAIIASFFLVTTITLAILYGMELHNKNFNQTQQGMYYEIQSEENDRTETFIVNSDCNQK